MPSIPTPNQGLNPPISAFQSICGGKKHVLMSLYHSIFSFAAPIQVYFNSYLTDSNASLRFLMLAFIHPEAL